MHPFTPFGKIGPVKWCRYCGAKHPARQDCGFEEVTRIAKSGNIVKRFMVPVEGINDGN